MLFGDKILDYWDDIMKDLSALVAVPSVAKPTEGPHPFGDECARALDTVLSLAEGYGLKTKNVDYYAGHAEYGEGPENAVVMAHVDVVPEGEGWDTDPFTMTVKGDLAFGRGVGDDKGAAIIALHCLRALKDAGVPAKRKLRVIFGCGEEIGMADMGHYFEKEQHPDMGFTPDSCYGICHCEKGIMNFTVSGAGSEVVESFSAGTVSNAVPAKAVCTVKCTPEEWNALEKAAASCEIPIITAGTTTGGELLAKGQASHAAMPQGGKNAASYLIKLLYEVFGAEKVGPFYSFIAEKISLSTDGSLLGVDMSDEASGPLTFNLGLVHTKGGSSGLTVDIRYPATREGKRISDTIANEAAAYGLTFTLLSDAAPLYLPKESPLISLLAGAYKAVTGEECSVFSMGGGTYARQMFGKGVAFGPGFPDQTDSHEHDANERIELSRMKVHARICLEAMYRMLTAE